MDVVYGPLALLLVATALFPAAVVWRRSHDQEAARLDGAGREPGPRADPEQVQGFVYVGSGALVVLGIGVLVLGLAGRTGPAEAMGVVGLMAYLVYLVVAVLLIRRTAIRSTPRRELRREG